MKETIANEFQRHDEILPHLTYDADRKKFLRFVEQDAHPEEYLSALKFLSKCLAQAYDNKEIILIDE